LVLLSFTAIVEETVVMTLVRWPVPERMACGEVAVEQLEVTGKDGSNFIELLVIL